MSKKCARCKLIKDDDQFYRSEKTGRLQAYCKPCGREHHKEWRKTATDLNKARNRRYYDRHKSEIEGKVAEYARKNPHIRRKAREAWEERNPEWRDKFLVKLRKSTRDQVFEAYGGFVCACCGETEPKFMTIDHIHNGGNKHRRELATKIGRGGTPFFAWLRREGFPPGYQVLCRNCNWGKHANGGICPHQCSEGSSTIPKGSRAEAIAARSAEPQYLPSNWVVT